MCEESRSTILHLVLGTCRLAARSPQLDDSFDMSSCGGWRRRRPKTQRNAKRSCAPHQPRDNYCGINPEPFGKKNTWSDAESFSCVGRQMRRNPNKVDTIRACVELTKFGSSFVEFRGRHVKLPPKSLPRCNFTPPQLGRRGDSIHHIAQARGGGRRTASAAACAAHGGPPRDARSSADMAGYDRPDEAPVRLPGKGRCAVGGAEGSTDQLS